MGAANRATLPGPAAPMHTGGCPITRVAGQPRGSFFSKEMFSTGREPVSQRIPRANNRLPLEPAERA